MQQLKQIISSVISAFIWSYRDCRTLLFNALHSPQFVMCVLWNRVNHRNNFQVSLCRSRFNQCRIGVTGVNNSLVIDDGCSLSGLKIGLRMGGVRICRTTINSTLERRVSIGAMEGCIVEIGEGCLLSDNIYIHTTDYHPIYDENGQRSNPPADIIIGKHVWIGKDAMLLKGTHIADGCIIGARSVLNKQYNTSNSLIAGTPGKALKTGIHWQQS